MSPEDLDALRQYTGEGGLGKKATQGEGILDEFYTSYEVVDWIWRKLGAMGWKGKKVLEPASGIGNFVGLGPEGLKWTLIERESVSSKIASILYPGASVENKIFQELTGEEGTYDLVISNPPFLEFWTGKYLEGAKPYRDITALHDMFVVKGLDQLKPGGVLAYVISTGAMDKLDPGRVRHAMHERAELVAAYRFPSGIFKKNADFAGPVDVLFFQKRMEPLDPKAAKPKWLESREREEYEGAKLNEYFVEHPENVGGTLEAGLGQEKLGQMGVRPKAGDDYMQRWMADDAQIEEVREAERPAGKSPEEKLAEELEYTPSKAAIESPEGLLPGQHHVERGKLYVANVFGFSEPWRGPAEIGVKLHDLAVITRTLGETIKAFGRGDSERGTVTQAVLRRQVDEYMRKNQKPPSSDPKLIEWLEEDPYFAHVRNLVDPAGNYADVVTNPAAFANPYRRQVVNRKDIEAVAQDVENRDGSVSPAVAFALYDGGRFKSVEALRQYFHGSDQWNVLADGTFSHDRNYLYGDIRRKRDEARAAGLTTQAAKLDAVMPEQRTSEAVAKRVSPAERWIPKSVVQDFAMWMGGSEFKLDRALDKWDTASDEAHFKHKWAESVQGVAREFTIEDTPENRQVYGGLADGRPHSVRYVDWEDLMLHALNGRLFNETTRISTAEAQALNRFVLPKIRDAFGQWLETQPRYLQTVTDQYNYNYASWRDRWGSPEEPPPPELLKIEIDGFSTSYFKQIHPWQALFHNIATTQGRAANSTDTGGGKTLALILVAQTLKQTGRSRIPIFAVPSGVLEKWKHETQLAFPGARILDLGNLSTAQGPRGLRKTQEMLARLRLNEYDYVYVTREGLMRIPMSPEYQVAFFQKKIDALVDEAHKASSEMTKRELQKRIARLRDEVKESQHKAAERAKAAKKGLKQAAVYFDELGFDALFVDEAHNYKNTEVLGSQIAGQLSMGSASAARAMDMQMKAHYILEKTGNRNVFLATASPTPNQPTDIYNMLSLIAPDMLERHGIGTMDGFLSRFFDYDRRVLTNAVGEPQAKNVVVGMRNLNDLREIFHRYFYFRVGEQLRDQFPTYRYDKPAFTRERIILPPTPETERQLGQLQHRMDGIRRMKGKKKAAALASLQQDARAVAVGPGILDPLRLADYRHENFKLERLAQDLAATYHELARAGLRPKDGQPGPDLNGHITFLDVFGETSKTRKVMSRNYHEWLRDRIIELGVPRPEVEIISGKYNNTPIKKFSVSQRYNAGLIRVVIGSTPSMGEGMDLHRITTHMYKADIPWNPELSRQRDGRGVRQGNLGDHVHIREYVTTRTMDAKMAQTNLTKEGFLIPLFFGKTENMKNPLSEDVNITLDDMAAALRPNRAHLDMQRRQTEFEETEGQLRDQRGALDATQRHLEKAREETDERETRLASLKAKQMASKQEGAYQTMIDREVARLEDLRKKDIPGFERTIERMTKDVLPKLESAVVEAKAKLEHAVRVNRYVEMEERPWEDAVQLVAFESFGIKAPPGFSAAGFTAELRRLADELTEYSKLAVRGMAAHIEHGNDTIPAMLDNTDRGVVLKRAWKNLYKTELKVGPRSVGSAGARPAPEEPKARRRTGTLADGAVGIPAGGREPSDAEVRILTRGGARVDRARHAKLGQAGMKAEQLAELSQAERVVHVLRRVGAARDPRHLENILRADKYRVWTWEDADVELVLTRIGERMGEQDLRHLTPEIRRFVRRLDSDAPRGRVSGRGLDERRALRWVFGLLPARTALRGTGIVERMRSSYEAMKREFNAWVDYSEHEMWLDDKGKHLRAGGFDDRIIFQLVNNAEGDPRWLDRPTVRLLDGKEYAPKDWHRRVGRELAEIFDELARAQELEPERTRKFYITNIVDRVLAFEKATRKDRQIIHGLAKLKLGEEYEFTELERRLGDLNRAKALQIMDFMRGSRAPRSMKGLQRGLDVILGADDRSTIPDELYQPYLKRRYGNLPPIESAHLAFETYLRYALRKIHLEPAVHEVKPLIEEMHGKGLGVGPVLLSQREYAERYIDRILGRPTVADVALERWAESLNEITHGRLARIPIIRGLFRPKPATRATSALLRAQYFRLLGLAVDSAITNLSQGINTATRFGLRDAFAGYLRLMDPKFRKLIHEEHLLHEFQSFYRGPEAFYARPLSKIEQLALKPFTWAELINRGAAFAAGIQHGKRIGLSAEESLRLGQGRVSAYLEARRPEEARRAGYTSPLLQYAREAVIETQFGYSPVEGSPVFGTPGGRTLFQFFTYPTQQGAMLWEGVFRRHLAREAGLGDYAWMRYLALAGFTTVAGKELAEFFGLDAANLFSVWGVVPQGPGPNVQLGLDLWAAIPGWTGRETMSSKMAEARLKYGYAPKPAGALTPLTLTRFGRKVLTREGPYRFLPVAPAEPPDVQRRRVRRQIRRQIER